MNESKNLSSGRYGKSRINNELKYFYCIYFLSGSTGFEIYQLKYVMSRVLTTLQLCTLEKHVKARDCYEFSPVVYLIFSKIWLTFLLWKHVFIRVFHQLCPIFFKNLTGIFVVKTRVYTSFMPNSQNPQAEEGPFKVVYKPHRLHYQHFYFTAIYHIHCNLNVCSMCLHCVFLYQISPVFRMMKCRLVTNW